MKKRFLFGTLLSCTVLLAACGGGDKTTESTGTEGNASNSEQVFNVAVPQEMPSADLSIARDTISFTALNNVYEGLYRLDADNKPIPAGAAEMAKISEDGLTYTFHLREDAVWSNGEPVTADDYVTGWQRTVDPKTASEYAYLYAPVANAEKITAGEADVSELGIEAVSDYELKVTLDVATPYFDYLLAFPSFFPQNKAIVEEKGDNYAQTSDDAIYNGPFVLTGFDGPGVDTEWGYEKNEDYWDAENVKLEQINVTVVKESATGLNLFQDGALDDVTLSGELAQQNASNPDYVVDKESRTSYLALNQEASDSPFRNINLRKAISYAIDRESMVKQVLGDGSVASTTIIPEGMSFDPDNDKDFVEEAAADLSYDPEKAKEYWEKAKSELGIDKLEVEFLADDTDSVRAVSQYVQGALQETLDGFTVKLSVVPISVRLDRQQQEDYDIVMGGWGADYADPSTFLDLFTTEKSTGRGKWSNAEYDALMEEAATTNATNPSARWKNMLDAEKILMDDMGVVPVYQRASGHLRAEKIQDVVVHGAGASYDYKWASVK